MLPSKHWFQITDTPGVLDRGPELRNRVEQLTFVVLDHLNPPPLVMFVMDQSGHSGYDWATQASLRERIKVSCVQMYVTFLSCLL